MASHFENFQQQERTNKGRPQIEGGNRQPHQKKQKIATEQLLEEVEKLMSKKHQKPNASLIESKTSLSQKNAMTEDDTSVNQTNQRYHTDKYQNLISYTSSEISANNQTTPQNQEVSFPNKVLLSQFSQSSHSSNQVFNYKAQRGHQESLYENNPNNLIEDYELRASGVTNSSQITKNIIQERPSDISQKQNETVYSSFSEFQDGQIRVQKNDIKVVPGQNYQGIFLAGGGNQQYSWLSQDRFSKLYKFPMLLSSPMSIQQQQPLVFAKCNLQIEQAIENIHLNSPFKKGILCERKQQDNQKQQNQVEERPKSIFEQIPIQQQIHIHRKRQNANSFQSEDVLDTLEEMGADDIDYEEMKGQSAGSRIGRDIDQALENSLNKSNLTMEDNNKAHKQKKQKVSKVEVQEPPRISNGQLSIIQNEKVFELRMDDFNNDTSFDTLTSERLFATCTEDQFPLTSSKNNTHRQSKISQDGQGLADDSIIERELKKINQNLNTFTVEHFNNLRSQIQTVGFQNASQKAKRDFNLITNESINTIVTGRDDDAEISITEETKIQNQFQNMYANNTTASKNLYQVNFDSRMLQMNQMFDDKIFLPNGLSPLLRKVIICEQYTQRNHNIIEITHSSPCSGFNSAPSILFSDQENESKAFIEKNQNNQIVLGKLISPSTLNSLMKTSVTWITCGFEHCLVLTIFGQVASWGYGASGCLGHGNYVSYTQPKYIQALDGKFITFIESGGYHNAVIDTYGNLYTWGRSDVGQLGFPKNQLQSDDLGHLLMAPKHLLYFSQIKRRVKQVALGEAHTIILDNEGHVYSFGWGEHGQLGVPINKESDPFKINKIKFFEQFPCQKISSGSVFSLALTLQHGRIYIWGSGQNGQLGLGNIKSLESPVFVDFLQHERIVDVNCGDSHVIALCESGKIYGWGQGITKSRSLMKNLRESSMNSQHFSTYGGPNNENQALSMNPSLLQLDVICSLPKLLIEVDIAHTFLLKKKTQLIKHEDFSKQQAQKQLNQQLLKKTQNYTAMPHGGIGRILPSNNTICEVSERDSDFEQGSKIHMRGEVKSTVTSGQGSFQNQIQQQHQIPSSLSKFGQQNDQEYRLKIEMLQQDIFNKQKRSQSPIVQDSQYIASDSKAFGNKKQSMQSHINNPLFIENPSQIAQKNQRTQYGQVCFTPNQMLENSQVKQKVNRNEIMSKLEEFTHSHIQMQDQMNDSHNNTATFKNVSIKAKSGKNQIKNINIQSSLGVRNQKLQIQTQGSQSIVESHSTKRIKHISSMAQSDWLLNNSQQLILNSNNSSRISNRDSDQLGKSQNTGSSMKNNQSTIKRVRSPQPDLMVSKVKSKINTAQKKILSPGKSNVKTKNTPTPRNQLQIRDFQQYASQSVLNPAVQSAQNKIATQPTSTRNKNLQIKISTNNTLGSNSSFKKTGGIQTTNHQSHNSEVLTYAKGSGHIVHTMATPLNNNESARIGNLIASTTKSSHVSSLISPSRMLSKNILNTQQNETKRHQKQPSLTGATPTSVFNFKEKAQQKPRGPKIGMGGSGQQFKLGVQSAKVSPKSKSNINYV